MKNPNSPFRIMMRTIFYGLLISVGAACLLLGTSKNTAQALAAILIFVLSALLSIVVGFYLGLRAYHKREQEREAEARAAVHYPARARVEVYMRGRHFQ
jgi:choline-glycine betaine transporter